MIEFNQVSKSFTTGHRALNNVSFCIKTGELALLVGPPGAGKTTLFQLLLGLSTPTEGNIFLNGHNLTTLKKDTLLKIRQNTGMVFQAPQLLMNATAFNNVALPLELAAFKPREIKRRTDAALQKVGLSAKASQFAGTFSSGEQKQLEIARALVTTPKLLLIDDPFAHIDQQSATTLLHLFETLHALGLTLVIATHHPHLFKANATSVLYLSGGCLQKKESRHVHQTQFA